MTLSEPQIIFNYILGLVWMVIKVWWWFILPVLLYFPAKILYKWWINWEVWYKELEWIMLEIIPPAEVLKPFRAMEDMFTAIWPIYDGANWREQWCEGELILGPEWVSFETVSIEGQIHFYLRCLKEKRNFVESIIHTHYPDAEIFQVPDYTQNVPQNIPNKEYDIYGEDYILLRDDPFPIRTYKFFEIRPEEIEAEKKLDPLPNLLEALAKLKKGEQVWFQMVICPILDSDVPWVTQGKALVDKIARRPSPPKDKTIAGEAFRALAFDSIPFEQKAKEESIIPPEMKLTPGEREVLGAVEEKISKLGFKTHMRVIYLYKREARFSPNGKIFRSYFLHFNTQDLNGIRFWGKTRTKIHYLFRKRRLSTRKKNIFYRYVKRFTPKFPKRVGPGTSIFNAEELATIFHFPTSTASLPSSVPRVPTKKGGPPPNIPFE